MLQNGCYPAIGCLYNRATFSVHLWFQRTKNDMASEQNRFCKLTTLRFKRARKPAKQDIVVYLIATLNGLPFLVKWDDYATKGSEAL